MKCNKDCSLTDCCKKTGTSPLSQTRCLFVALRCPAPAPGDDGAGLWGGGGVRVIIGRLSRPPTRAGPRPQNVLGFVALATLQHRHHPLHCSVVLSRHPDTHPLTPTQQPLPPLLPPSLFFLLLLLRCLGLVRRCALSIPSLPPSSPWIAACLQFAVFVSG